MTCNVFGGTLNLINPIPPQLQLADKSNARSNCIQEPTCQW